MNESDKRTEWYDAREVTAAARDRWPDVLSRLGVDAGLLRNTHGPCPGCGGKDRFRFDDKEGSGSFICSQGGGGNLAGYGTELLMHVNGWEWKKAVNELGAALGLQPKHGQRREDASTALNAGVAAEPRAEKAKGKPEIDMERVQDFIRGTPAVDEGWLRRRSPVDVAKVESGDFLNALFQQGERVLIFTEEHSQGNFLWVAGKPHAELLPCAEKETGLFGGWRLAQDRHTKAVRSALPRTERLGIWYLVQPVSGKWEVKPDVKWTEAEGQWSKDVQGKYTRRSAVNVTAWRYLVLESDELPAETWLRVVADLPLPISALYTSGGRSIHALLRLPAGSKTQWDGVRDALRALVCPLGADAGALSAVRLSRLPCCFREGAMQKGGGYVRYPKARRQELLYLNPNPDGTPLLLSKEVRA